MDKITRRFQVASSFVRMIRAQRGFERAIEGHFPRQVARNAFVHIRSDGADLVLLTGEYGAAEERTVVPRSHAEALLDVCAGAIVYERTRIPVADGLDATIDRLVRPQGPDIVTVVFPDLSGAESFLVPPWFGPEVDDAFSIRTAALDGVQPTAPVEPTNRGLDVLLDLAESGLLRRAARETVVENADSARREPRPVLREAHATPEEPVAPSSRPEQRAGEEGDPAMSSLRSIFSAQRPSSTRERQRVPGE